MMKVVRTASRLLLVAALAACADGNIGNPDITGPSVTPEYSNGNNGNGNGSGYGYGYGYGNGNGYGNNGNGNNVGNGNDNSVHKSRPNRRDLMVLAKYRWSNRDPESMKLIGPAGGRVRAGDYEVIVPEGAVEKWSVFHIKLPNGGGRGGRVYAEFTSSRPFTKPVTIILPQDITTASDQSTILWWNDEALQWDAMPTTPTSDGRLQTSTPHFSIYGVAKSRGWIQLGG